MSTLSETNTSATENAPAPTAAQANPSPSFEYPKIGESNIPCRNCQFESLRSTVRENASSEQIAREARELGVREGESRTQAHLEQALAAERHAISDALAEFARQRDAYYQHVESEVVQLALSIARKVLHREAQLDPLLLAGVAHVALEKVKEGTRVTLRVSPAKAASFRDFFAQQHDLRSAPEIVEDQALGPDHCVLETDLGCTALGIEEQLKEVEQNFFDLLAQRPRT